MWLPEALGGESGGTGNASGFCFGRGGSGGNVLGPHRAYIKQNIMHTETHMLTGILNVVLCYMNFISKISLYFAKETCGCK